MESHAPSRVAVVAKSEVVRSGLALMLDRAPFVGEYVTFRPDEFARASVEDTFQILILSCRVLIVCCVDGSGAGADAWAAELVRVARKNGIRVLLLLSGAGGGRAGAVPTLPCDGYLHQDDVTMDALRRLVLEEQASVPAQPSAPRAVVESPPEEEQAQPGADGAMAVTPLSQRERQVLELLAEGLSNSQIGQDLGMSEHGVKRLVAIVLSKLNCRNRAQAVAVALREGILSAGSRTGGANRTAAQGFRRR